MKVERVDGFAAIGAAAWGQLHARAAFPSPFLSWSWQTEWYAAFGESRRLVLLSVRDREGEPVGLLPLYEHQPGLLRLVGGVDVSDYLDLIAAAGREEEVWAALLQSRAGSTEIWDLHCLPAASPTPATVPVLAPGYGLTAERAVEGRCPVLDLPAEWPAYLAGLDGKNRHELLRKMRRLERECPGAAVVAHATAEAIEAHLSEFFRLHRGSLAGKARFMDERMEGFFRAVLRALVPAGGVRLWFLECSGQALATFICLEWAGGVGLYNSGFDVRRAALSPGIVLLGKVVKDAIERGVSRFDFLRGEEPYKLALGGRPQDVFALRVAA